MQPLATPTAQPQAPSHQPTSQTPSHQQQLHVRSDHFFPSSHPLPPPLPPPLLQPVLKASDASQVSVFNYRVSSHVIPGVAGHSSSTTTVAAPSVMNASDAGINARPSDFIEATPPHMASAVQGTVASAGSAPSLSLQQQMTRLYETGPATSTDLATGALNALQSHGGQVSVPNSRHHGEEGMGHANFNLVEADPERNGIAVGGKRKKATSRSKSSKRQRMDYQHHPHLLQQQQLSIVEDGIGDVDDTNLPPLGSSNQERDPSSYVNIAGQQLPVAEQPAPRLPISATRQPLSAAGQPLPVAVQPLPVAGKPLSVAGQPPLSVSRQSLPVARQLHLTSRSSVINSIQSMRPITTISSHPSPSGPLRIENPGHRGPVGPPRADDPGPRGPNGPLRTDNSASRGPTGPSRSDNPGPRAGAGGAIRSDNPGPRVRVSGSVRNDNPGPRGPGGAVTYYDSGTHLPGEAAHPQQRPTVLSTQGGVATPISRTPADPLRSRLGVAPQSAASPQAPTVAASGPVATPLSQLASSGHASSRGDVRMAPEFGYIRVKVEPRDEEEEGRGTPPYPTSTSIPSTRVREVGCVVRWGRGMFRRGVCY